MDCLPICKRSRVSVMDTVDPATGLTPREKAAVQENWNKVMQDSKGNGSKFFIKLFNESEEVFGFFAKRFSGMTMEEIQESARLKSHVVSFMNGLTGFIDNLDDTGLLVELIHDTAQRHYFRKIRPQQFKITFRIFMDFLQEAFGEAMDEFTKTSWEKTLAAVESVVTQYMDNKDEAKKLKQASD